MPLPVLSLSGASCAMEKVEGEKKGVCFVMRRVDGCVGGRKGGKRARGFVLVVVGGGRCAAAVMFCFQGYFCR